MFDTSLVEKEQSVKVAAITADQIPKQSRKKMDKVSFDETLAVYKHLNEKALTADKELKFDDVVSDCTQYGRIQFWDEKYLNDQGWILAPSSSVL